MSAALNRYFRQSVTVPNGRVFTGMMVGRSAVTLLEHALRDELATTVGGVTEASLGYGRADVLTTDTVFEVEPCGAWRHAVHQAIQYAAQTGCQPAIALFGAAHRDQVLDMYLRLRDGLPSIGLWWRGDYFWQRISSRAACRSMREPIDPRSRSLISRMPDVDDRSGVDGVGLPDVDDRSGADEVLLSHIGPEPT